MKMIANTASSTSMANLTDSQRSVLLFVEQIYPHEEKHDLASLCHEFGWDSGEISRYISENPENAVKESWKLIENRKRKKKEEFKQAPSSNRKKKQFGKRSRKRNDRRKNKSSKKERKKKRDKKEEKQPQKPLVIHRSTTVSNNGSWAQKVQSASNSVQGERPSNSPLAPLTNITDQSKNELIPPRNPDILQTPPGILSNAVWLNVHKVEETETELENNDNFPDFYRDQNPAQFADKQIEQQDHVDVFSEQKQAYSDNVDVYEKQQAFEKPPTKSPTHLERGQYSRSTDKQAFNDNAKVHYSDFEVAGHVYHQFGDPVLHEHRNVQAYSGTASRSRPESVSGVTMPPSFGANAGPFSAKTGVTMPENVAFTNQGQQSHVDFRLPLNQTVKLPPQIGQMNSDAVFQFGCDYVEDDRKVQSNEKSQEDVYGLNNNEYLIQQNDILAARGYIRPQRQREVEIHTAQQRDPAHGSHQSDSHQQQRRELAQPAMRTEMAQRTETQHAQRGDPAMYGQAGHRNQFNRNAAYRGDLGGLSRSMIENPEKTDFEQFGYNIIGQTRDQTSGSQTRLGNQFDDRRENIADNRRTFNKSQMHLVRTVNITEDNYDKVQGDIPPDNNIFGETKHFHEQQFHEQHYGNMGYVMQDNTRQAGLEEREDHSRQTETFYPQQNSFRANHASQPANQAPQRTQTFQKKQNYDGYVNVQSMPSYSGTELQAQTFDDKPDYSPGPPERSQQYGAQQLMNTNYIPYQPPTHYIPYQIQPTTTNYYQTIRPGGYTPARTAVVYPSNQFLGPYGPSR